MRTRAICALLLFLVASAHGDLTVFGPTGLSSSWQSWSYSATVNLQDNSLLLPGYTYDILTSIAATNYGALSLHANTPFGNTNYQAIQFTYAGAPSSALTITIEDSNNGASIQNLQLLSLMKSPPSATSYTTVTIDMTTMSKYNFDRISWFNENGVAMSFLIGSIVILTSLPLSTTFSGMEPMGSRSVVLYGGGSCASATVTLNSAAVTVSSRTVVAQATYVQPRCYLQLASSLAAGSLQVVTSGGTFSATIQASQAATLATTSSGFISDLIYGMAFQNDKTYVNEFGISITRWGGNSVTAYNPNGGFTNAGNDYYFENRASDSADAFIANAHAAGEQAFLTVPALDFVSKDATSYSYSVAKYGAQKATDPYKSDAGNGITTGNSPIQADTSTCYTAWTAAMAKTWLQNLVNKPDICSVDNELDITSGTHQDMHFAPMTYSELLNTRFITFAKAIKQALPSVKVAGPSSCCWYYYWNSAAGGTDKANNGNVDFLPWFLTQLAAEEATTGRLLDYLDIHYYPDSNVFTNDADSATQALRLRMTRTLWDSTYKDEGDIGTNPGPNNNQPNQRNPMLIPRFQQLIASLYPGTKLGITEWNFGAEGDISGGLAVADVLGIFGAQGLDLATYWTTPDAGSPAASAFWLFRDNTQGRRFGTQRLAFTLNTANPDFVGTYAALDGNNLLTFVIVNKHPTNNYLFTVQNLPAAQYLVRHFSGLNGGSVRMNGTLQLDSSSVVVVPAFAAFFAAQIASGGSSGGAASPTPTPTSIVLHTTAVVPTPTPTVVVVHTTAAAPTPTPTAVVVHTTAAAPTHTPTVAAIHTTAAAPTLTPTVAAIHTTAQVVHTTAAAVPTPTVVAIHTTAAAAVPTPSASAPSQTTVAAASQPTPTPTATSPGATSSPPDLTPTSTPTQGQQQQAGDSSPAGAIAGGVIGGIVAIALIVAAVAYYQFVYKPKQMVRSNSSSGIMLSSQANGSSGWV